MKVIVNKILPFKGFKLMTILWFLFSRVEEKLIELREWVHESIHSEQQEELLVTGSVISLVLCNIYDSWWYLLGVVLFPFIAYVLGWFVEMLIPPYHNVDFHFEKGDGLWRECVKLCKGISKIAVDAYFDNAFEREAFMNEHNPEYLTRRMPYAWVLYILRKGERTDA